MKIAAFETFLANAGLRNYLFIRLRTDSGLTGIGEASLEWQEQTVETLCHEWLQDRLLGCDPFDIEAVIGGLIRDQYQGGSTVMTAISGAEIAMWDIIGKSCGQPVIACWAGAATTACRPMPTAGMVGRNPRIPELPWPLYSVATGRSSSTLA
jgi:galactonate dehydratase